MSTLAFVLGVVAGVLLLKAHYRWFRPWWWRLRGACVCTDGMIRVGNREGWHWEPCPFCREDVAGSGEGR